MVDLSVQRLLADPGSPRLASFVSRLGWAKVYCLSTLCDTPLGLKPCGFFRHARRNRPRYA